jgi:hypothetical protein
MVLGESMASDDYLLYLSCDVFRALGVLLDVALRFVFDVAVADDGGSDVPLV